MLRRSEKTSGLPLTEQAVSRTFRKTLNKNPKFSLSRDESGSYVGSIIKLFVGKGLATQRTEEWRDSPEAAKMFNTSLPNLLNPEAVAKRLAATRMTKNTEAWKNSQAARNQAEGLRKGRSIKRRMNAWPARLDALFRTK